LEEDCKSLSLSRHSLTMTCAHCTPIDGFVDLKDQYWKRSSSQSRKRFGFNSRSFRSFYRHESKEEEGQEWKEVKDRNVTLERRKKEQTD